MKHQTQAPPPKKQMQAFQAAHEISLTLGERQMGSLEQIRRAVTIYGEQTVRALIEQARVCPRSRGDGQPRTPGGAFFAELKAYVMSRGSKRDFYVIFGDQHAVFPLPPRVRKAAWNHLLLAMDQRPWEGASSVVHGQQWKVRAQVKRQLTPNVTLCQLPTKLAQSAYGPMAPVPRLCAIEHPTCQLAPNTRVEATGVPHWDVRRRRLTLRRAPSIEETVAQGAFWSGVVDAWPSIQHQGPFVVAYSHLDEMPYCFCVPLPIWREAQQSTAPQYRVRGTLTLASGAAWSAFVVLVTALIPKQ